MSDERQGLPSASSMERYFLCPGSYAAERGLPDTTSADADTGNRIHSVLAGDTVTPPLNDDEKWTMEACRSQASALLDTRLFDGDQMHLERRYWWNGDWSGKPDVVAIDTAKGRAVVIDYKTGRGEVEVAEGNMQLRALAVLAARQHGLASVIVAIIQPLAGQPSLCIYSSDDLKRAEAEISGIISAINRPDAPRIPSAKACKYCKAKTTCPEAREAALATPVANVPANTTPEAIAAALTGPTLAQFLDRAEMAVRVIEACREEAKRRLESGDTVLGWTLKPGSERETITDPTTVYNRASAAGVTSEAFMACVGITKGKLKDALKTATGEKGKALEARMESLLAGCTEVKQSAATLAKVKEGA